MTTRKEETAAKRKATIAKRFALKLKLVAACPTCEVPGCFRDATDMHHMKNPGLAMKDDSYENLSALCHEHHMQMDAPNWSQKRWAHEFWFGGTYDQYRAYIALRRRYELKGKIPAPELQHMSMLDMPQDVMDLAVLYARKLDLLDSMELEEDD
jgi:hypothetical protein